MISTKELEEQKKILLEKRNSILKRIDLLRSNGESNAGSNHGDDLDRAAISGELEMNYILNDRKRMELKAIDRTIKKINNGVYGICEMCGKKIGKKRLKTLPLTPYCRICQSEME